MIIEAKQTTPAPDGEHSWVITDVLDVGMIRGKFGEKPTVKIVGVIDKVDEAGQPIQVHKLCNRSVTPRSNFYKFVEQATGKPPARKFDTALLIGVQCQITTKQRVTERGTFANIVTVRPLPASTPRVAIPLRPEKSNGSTDRAVAFP